MLVNNPMRKWSEKLNRHFTKNKQNKTLKNKMKARKFDLESDSNELLNAEKN